MKLVRVFDDARDDVEAAVAYYENERQGLGLEFFDDFELTIEGVKEGLLPGSPITGHRSKRRVLRVKLRRFPYKLIIVELPQMLAVVAVANRYQRDFWRDRIAKVRP